MTYGRSMIPVQCLHQYTLPRCHLQIFCKCFYQYSQSDKPEDYRWNPCHQIYKSQADRCQFPGHEKVRKQAHATPKIIANSTANPDTYKVPVIAGRRPYCGVALTGRHSDDGRNILIPTSLKAGILSFKICINIIPISAATTKVITYIKTLQNVFAIFLYITKSFLHTFGIPENLPPATFS